jgi:hypothetical protein
VEKDAKLWESIVVKDLTEKDFHLFEDGQEQKIQRVRLEPPAFRVVQDNLGKHPEIVGSGGGLWAYPDLPKTDPSVWLAWPQYVLAYVPPNSAPGSCHQIRVGVPRAALTVWTRSEYCNTAHPASDPLSGTEFGKKMEAAMTPARGSDLDLKLNVASFSDDANAGRIYVSMEFPWQALKHEFRDGTLYATIGTLLMVYGKDGTLAARYSDFACCDYGNEKQSGGSASSSSEAPATAGRARLPDRYEKQFALPSGEYEVRAILSDGVHFGVQKARLTVRSFEADKLGISDVVLSRRVRKVPTEETEAAARATETYTPLVSKDVEFTPAASTQYWMEEMLFAYFEIHDPDSVRQGGKVQANLRIVDANSGAVMDTFEPVDTATYRNSGSAVIAVGRGVKLNHLSPGAYRLEVQVSDTEGRSTAWRSAEFTVIEAAPLEIKSDAGNGK